jgi:hypothetical protein
MLTAGKEREYLSWFYATFAYNPEAITEADIDEYVSHYSEPGGMRAGFEYYRAFPITAEQNKEHANVKLPMPVLTLSGGVYRKCSIDFNEVSCYRCAWWYRSFLWSLDSRRAA